MTQLIALLAEEMEELMKGRKPEWRITQLEVPDPNKYPRIIVRDSYFVHEAGVIYVYKDGLWRHEEERSLRNWDPTRYKPQDYDFWRPFLEGHYMPSDEILDKFRQIKKKN